LKDWKAWNNHHRVHTKSRKIGKPNNLKVFGSNKTVIFQDIYTGYSLDQFSLTNTKCFEVFLG